MDDVVVPDALRRNHEKDPAASLDAAVRLIEHMCEHVGLKDLAATELLDFGCGVRFTEAFLNRGVAIRRYVGVETSRDIVDFLRDHVTDPRFEYIHIDAHNELYNPDGEPLSRLTVPELADRLFDLIGLFSVFTHLAPPDFEALLKLLRRHVAPTGRLFFSMFINERTETGHGYVDHIPLPADSPPPKIRIAQPDFIDAEPNRPLWVALYSRRCAGRLIEQSGWQILDISPPTPDIQHHITCAPAAPE